MALTFSKIAGPHARGNRWETVYEAAADASYPTGGWAAAPASLGFASTVDPEFNVILNSQGGYLLTYDHANQKVQAWRQTAATGALAEVPNTTDLSAVLTKMRITATGKYHG